MSLKKKRWNYHDGFCENCGRKLEKSEDFNYCKYCKSMWEAGKQEGVKLFTTHQNTLEKIGKIIDKCSVWTLNTSDRGTDEEIDVIDKEELKNKLGLGKKEPMCKCGHSFYQHSQAHDRCDYCDCKKFNCQHINKDIEIDEKRFFCNDCNEWINCEDLKK